MFIIRKYTLFGALLVTLLILFGSTINSTLENLASLYFYDEQLQRIIPRDGLNLLIKALSENSSINLSSKSLTNWAYINNLLNVIPYARQAPYLLFFVSNLVFLYSFFISYLFYQKKYNLSTNKIAVIGIFVFAVPPFALTAFLFPSKDLYSYLASIYICCLLLFPRKAYKSKSHNVISIIVLILSFVSRIQLVLVAILFIFSSKLKQHKYLFVCLLYTILIFILNGTNLNSSLDYQNFLETRGSIHSELNQSIFSYLSGLQQNFPLLSALISQIRFLLAIVGGYFQGFNYILILINNPLDLYFGLPALQDFIFSSFSTYFIIYLAISKGSLVKKSPEICLLAFSFILVIGSIPYPQTRYFWPLIVPFCAIFWQNTSSKFA